MTNIHTPGGGRVVALSPGPDDLFVVTTVAGRKVSLHTVEQFGHALKLAEAAANRMAPVPVSVKVLCLTLTEAQRFGLIPADLGKDETLEGDADRRQFVIRTLWDIVRNSRQVGWRCCMKCGKAYFSQDVIRQRMCDGCRPEQPPW